MLRGACRLEEYLAPLGPVGIYFATIGDLPFGVGRTGDARVNALPAEGPDAVLLCFKQNLEQVGIEIGVVIDEEVVVP